jgi:hypothetical protein
VSYEDLGALAAALAKAQVAFGPITRSRTVTVSLKTGGSYKFSYAPLDTILGAVRKPLADNGLALTQLINDNELVTLLIHESGGRLSSRTPLGPRGTVQDFGSAITYLRRYAVQSMLGIAAEEDDDGNRAAGNVAQDVEAGSRPAPEKATTNAAGETLELVGTVKVAGTIAKGGGSRTQLDWRETPKGHAIGFRIKRQGKDDVPQVIVNDHIGEALFAAYPDPATLDGIHVDVRGRLYQVKAPRRQAYYRLVVGESEGDHIETPDVRIPATIEAESVPLFDPAESARLDAAEVEA